MVHKTKGIVLRSVKFGETSVVVTLFTELFGLQAYLVNGVRTTSKKGSTKSAFFQPAAILDLIAYHNEFKNLNRLKEFKWAYLYDHILSDIKKNAVSLFMIELLTKCLKQPETNEELFNFMEDCLHQLDKASAAVTANFPLFFALHLAVFFGFRISDTFSETKTYLDLQEGKFILHQPQHPHFLHNREAAIVSHLLKIMQPAELDQVSISREERRRVTQALEEYYTLHIADFGTMRTLPVLREIMS